MTNRRWTMDRKQLTMIVIPPSGVQFNVVGSQSLMGIRVIVLVKSEHINKISCIEVSSVKTGEIRDPDKIPNQLFMIRIVINLK